ncbi:SDR family oxidoreductase [bacterium]|nr:SDR family oxidoreductase [bacterium]
MECLITGGAGFIGSNLARFLLGQGCRVHILDDLSTGRQENLSRIQSEVDFIRGDIRDLDTVRKAMQGCELVFHLAALPSVPRSIADPETSHSVNVNGTLNVLLAARDASVRRVMLASSSSVYGDQKELPRVETQPPRPLSPYAVSKLTGEYYARSFSVVYGLDTVSLRYFNVFGPHQDPDSPYAAVIPRFMEALSQGVSPVIYGDGSQSRDFTFVENVCRINWLAATAAEPLAGEVFNVGCGHSFTLLEILDRLALILGAEQVKPFFEAPRSGDVKHSLADIGKARRILGYAPEPDLTAELRLTCEWFGRSRDGNGR